MLLATVAAAIGCTSPAPDDADSASAPDSVDATDTALVDVEPIACAGLETSILVVPATRGALRDRFGPADSTHTATEPNRHMPEATDSLFVVFYPGLVVSLRRPSGGDDMADLVEITDGRYVHHAALRIGAPAARVLAALGEPVRRDAAALVYDCTEGAEQPVTFLLRNGAVAAIRIDYYVD